MVSSWRAVAGWAIPAKRASGSRVRPCAMSETTMTVVASTRMRSRRGRGAPLAVVRGMDRAAASGTTPRVPAQDTTAGTAQDGRRVPLRRWLTADSGKTHKIRVAISVPAIASASAGHASACARSRIRAGSFDGTWALLHGRAFRNCCCCSPGHGRGANSRGFHTGVLAVAVACYLWPWGRTYAMSGVDRVIVGTSGSPGSLRALRYAEVLARAHDAILMPVSAWVPPEGDRAAPLQSCHLRQVWHDRACQRLRDALIAVWGQVPDDPRREPHVVRGAAGWVLVSIACRPGDVLVVGAGRRGALARMVSCKVSRYCAAHDQCPVILVPPAALAQEVGHGRLAWVFWHRVLTPARVLRDQDRPAT